MAKTIYAPEGVTNFSYQGEAYLITNPDGSILVPDACAATLVESHGFRRSHIPDVVQLAAVLPAMPAADDDEDVAEDEPGEPTKPAIPSPAEFTMRMTQADMKAFLRQHNVTIPGSIKVKDLRALVEGTYEAVMTAPVPAPTDEPKTDETKIEG